MITDKEKQILRDAFFIDGKYNSRKWRNKEEIIVKSILSKFPKAKSLAEAIYEALYGMKHCPSCNERTSFINFSVGWHEYCSIKCAQNDERVRAKVNSSFEENWGCENIWQIDGCQLLHD